MDLGVAGAVGTVLSSGDEATWEAAGCLDGSPLAGVDSGFSEGEGCGCSIFSSSGLEEGALEGVS